MFFGYAFVSLFAWLISGIIKLTLQSIEAKRLAFDKMGYGGFPSSHSAIVSSITALIAMCDGMTHPAFGVSLAFTMIVLLDANCLRQYIGRQAQVINQLADHQAKPLRERVGHTLLQITAGVCVGIFAAWIIFHFFSSPVHFIAYHKVS